jgi:broad specificity phosphatase PhoE
VSERTTLLLVRHAPTPVTRAFRFPLDEELDDRGRLAASALTGRLRADRAVTSGARRCRETAAIAGFPDAEVEPDLAELDFGVWAGRDPHDLWERDRARLEAWYADPSSDAPDGGERFEDMQQRVVGVIERVAARGERTAMFTHGGPIKAAVLHALGAPPSAMWRLDVAPCSVTELHARPEGDVTVVSWNVPSGPVRE